MHLNQGIYFTLPDRKVWIYEEHEQLFRNNLHTSCLELYEFASSRGVTLCMENTCNFHIPFVKAALMELSSLDGFHLTWDVGHDAKAGFMEEPIFHMYPSKIKHMHLHDYNQISDHQIIYTGCVPIQSRLDFAKQNGIGVVVEVKTADALQISMSNIRERWA